MMRPHQPDGGEVSLETRRKRRKDDEELDYDRCIICQSLEVRTLNKVNKETVDKFKVALVARNDDVSDRLKEHVQEQFWLEQKEPKWHKQCRSWYIHEKGYMLALKKRGTALKETTIAKTHEAAPSTSSDEKCSTRSSGETFLPKKQCVICGKEYYRSKRPTLKVATKNREKAIIEKAEELKEEGEDTLSRITQAGHDMVANDICYHKECMDRFLTRKPKKGRSVEQIVYETTFKLLTEELEEPLFKEHKGFLIRSIRDRFRSMLEAHGLRYGNGIRSFQLKEKLLKHFGNQITILDESSGSGFVCSSDVKLGDAIGRLRKLEQEGNVDKRQEAVLLAAKIIREDMKLANNVSANKKSVDLSVDAAAKLIPDTLFNFSAAVLSGNKTLQEDSRRVAVEAGTEKKVILLSQQILQQATDMPTPLGTALAHHLYNATRSKSLVKLCNKLGQSISYDRLQRQLTSKAMDVMQQIEDTGVFIPENVSAQETPHIFAMDNLDWRKKTLEGGTFNATTSIVVQNTNCQEVHQDVRVPSSSCTNYKRSLPELRKTTMAPLNITKKERQRSRSLESVESFQSLQTECDEIADNLLLVWKVSRVAAVSNTHLDVQPTELIIPGFPTFCAQQFTVHDASKVGYFPLIPDTPTKPAVLQEAMKRVVETSQALGNEFTIITGDQATYELARTVREKNPGTFDKVILLIGGFHQALNFIRAICKIMRDSGAEDKLVDAGYCKEGTARKIFGEKADYYQSLHAMRLLNEAVWRQFFSAFEDWNMEQDNMQWTNEPSRLVQLVLDGFLNVQQHLPDIQHCAASLRECSHRFEETLQDRPTTKLWLTFLEMTDILLRFLCYQREGNWFGHLSESAKMLPFLTAAGHYKYGQQSLPQYIAKMKQLPTTAPAVYDSFLNGNFVARRTSGIHNAVSPDMLLEQTYNADAKEVSGLDAITTNESARTKWVYTKPLTAAASFQLKCMLDLDNETMNLHHEAGKAKVVSDAALVERVIECFDENPFTADHERLVNISTGQVASDEVQAHLTSVKEIGQLALDNAIKEKSEKKTIVKLNTFHTQDKKSKVSSRKQAPTKSKEVTALLRIVQIRVSGGDVDVRDFIGNHECAENPPSLFDDQGNMRSTGNKSSLVKALETDTNVQPLEQIPESPSTKMSTSVIVDAMFSIRKWSFEKDTPFLNIANRYRRLLATHLPSDTRSIHFCCDRYDANSLKSAERQRRGSEGKVFAVSDHYGAPDPKSFFSVSQNKAALLQYLCQKWVADEEKSTKLGVLKLYLAGGFQDVKETVMLTNGCASSVPELQSTQEEADTRLLLHAMYATKNEGVKRIVIHANDTDVIILCLYYYKTMLKDMGLKELWVKTQQDSHLPVHDIAEKLNQDTCHALPLLHSLSGRDTTSYPYYTGKKAWLQKCKRAPLDHLASFGEADFTLTEDVINQARQLIKVVYSSEGCHFKDLAELRGHKFLKNKDTNLKKLPPTEDSFLLHLKRAAFATIIDKTAYIAQPELPRPHDYGWTFPGERLTPLAMEKSPWPADAARGISCSCQKGCQKNCGCAAVNASCYIGCLCRGHRDTCCRTRYQEVLDIETSDSELEPEE